VADLLFRTAVPPSNLVLETSMAFGRLAKSNNFCRHFYRVTFCGCEKRLFIYRSFQSAAGFSLHESAPEMASRFMEQIQEQAKVLTKF
jgi:hypothetical protein